MKLTWHTETNCTVSAEHPDETMSRYFAIKFREAWEREAIGFMEEVSVTLRKCKPGEVLNIESRPIKVTISRADETPAANQDVKTEARKE